MGKEKRCIICKKLLLNERIPICPRCLLSTRNKGAKVVGGAAFGTLMFLGAKELKDRYKND